MEKTKQSSSLVVSRTKCFKKEGVATSGCRSKEGAFGYGNVETLGKFGTTISGSSAGRPHLTWGEEWKRPPGSGRRRSTDVNFPV